MPLRLKQTITEGIPGKSKGRCPLPSDRQHLSRPNDVCLEVRGEIIRTVLCCIVY